MALALDRSGGRGGPAKRPGGGRGEGNGPWALLAASVAVAVAAWVLLGSSPAAGF